jgi:hypothetical protein
VPATQGISVASTANTLLAAASNKHGSDENQANGHLSDLLMQRWKVSDALLSRQYPDAV